MCAVDRGVCYMHTIRYKSSLCPATATLSRPAGRSHYLHALEHTGNDAHNNIRKRETLVLEDPLDDPVDTRAGRSRL